MTLVNETGQPVQYWITNSNNTECGNIDVDGEVNLPEWDNQANVSVGFSTVGTPQTRFTMNCAETGTGQQVEMAVVAEAGDANS